MTDKDIWTIQLDWLNITNLIGLDSIIDIPDDKKDKAIKRISKTYNTNTLLQLAPEELDKLVAHELRDLMRKELALQARKLERAEKQMRSKMIPFKHGEIIKMDPRDFEDLDPDADPEDILKYFYKKFMGKKDNGDNDDRDDDKDNYREDNTGYYI